MSGADCAPDIAARFGFTTNSCRVCIFALCVKIIVLKRREYSVIYVLILPHRRLLYENIVIIQFQILFDSQPGLSSLQSQKPSARTAMQRCLPERSAGLVARAFTATL